METRAHQVVLVCSVGITAALILENSPRMIVRAVGKAETRPFTHSRSLEKPLKGCYDQRRLQACNDGVLCIYSGQITIFERITRSSKLSSTKLKRTNRHFAVKVKATKFASASTGQVRRLRTCTMMYNASAFTRDNAINHASVASRQFFTGTMETMRGFVFAGGGGGGGVREETGRFRTVKRCVPTGNQTRVSGMSLLHHNHQTNAAQNLPARATELLTCFRFPVTLLHAKPDVHSWMAAILKPNS